MTCQSMHPNELGDKSGRALGYNLIIAPYDGGDCACSRWTPICPIPVISMARRDVFVSPEASWHKINRDSILSLMRRTKRDTCSAGCDHKGSWLRGNQRSVGTPPEPWNSGPENNRKISARTGHSQSRVGGFHEAGARRPRAVIN